LYVTHSLSNEEDKEIYPLQLKPGRVVGLQFEWKESTCSVYIFWSSRTTAVSVVTEDSSAGFCASFSTRKFSQSFRVKPTKM
jgi:hypothetical protein